MKVWVVTVGVRNVFDSVWVTKKLAWLHMLKKGRACASDVPDYVQQVRFSYSPEKDTLTVQGHHKDTPLEADSWESLEVYFLNEEHVQGDAVDALAAVSADE